MNLRGKASVQILPNQSRQDECQLNRHRPPKKGLLVQGARRIWGTLQTTSVRAVNNAISSLTNIPAKLTTIKMKYKVINNPSSQHIHRWFILRADETLLQDLENCWDSVALQTNGSTHLSYNTYLLRL